MLETVGDEAATEIILGLSREHGAAHDPPFHGADLATQHLQHVGDGHPGRDGVGVDEDVRGHAVCGEGHHLAGHQQAHYALLPVTGGELVADLGYAQVADMDLHHPGAVLGLRDHHVVDPALLAGPDDDGGLTTLLWRQEVRLFLQETRG